MERLLGIIQREHMPRRLNKYYKRNVLVERCDIESEFLLACWKSVNEAKLDLGNPLLYILWKGERAVLQIFRKNVPKGVSVKCHKCKKITRLLRRGGRSLCAVCESDDVITFMNEIGDSQLTNQERIAGRTSYDRAKTSTPYTDTDDIFSMHTLDHNIEQIQGRLRGRVLELFNILVIEGINRDSSENYLSEIATRWGVTTACVSVYLKKLRVKVLDYYNGDIN